MEERPVIAPGGTGAPPRDAFPASPRIPGDRPFVWALGLLGGSYVILVLALVFANCLYATGQGARIFFTPEIQYSIWFSLATSSLSALLSVGVAVPLGYLLSRARSRGSRTLGALARAGVRLVDAVVDIPIVLPPLVVGISLLLLFATAAGRAFEKHVFPVTYQRVSVVIAQFAVAAAFAVRTMKLTFDQMTPRSEQVAMTLGCSRAQAFVRVVLPEARRGILTAFTIAWARSFGEFGPILVFSGATRLRTEVLSTTVFLQISIGQLPEAVAVSLFMIGVALGVLLVLRLAGPPEAIGRAVGP